MNKQRLLFFLLLSMYSFVFLGVLTSQIHCLDPINGETVHVATGLPMMLTSLAILPRRIAASSLNQELERMEAGPMDVNLDDFRRAVDSAEDADFDDCNEIVAAVGGLGGGVQLVGMHVSDS